MADQKGLNSNRNHHDSLSNSGGGRARHDNYADKSIFDSLAGFGAPKKSSPYGQGKHSKGGKPKQYHW